MGQGGPVAHSLQNTKSVETLGQSFLRRESRRMSVLGAAYYLHEWDHWGVRILLVRPLSEYSWSDRLKKARLGDGVLYGLAQPTSNRQGSRSDNGGSRYTLGDFSIQ